MFVFAQNELRMALNQGPDSFQIANLGRGEYTG